MSADSGEKTEKATPQRMKDVRKDGGLEKSQDVAVWLAVLAGALMLPAVLAKGRSAAIAQLDTVRTAGASGDPAQAVHALEAGLSSVLPTVSGLLLASVAVAFAANVAQGGVRPSAARLKPHLKVFNPVTGLKRMVGKQAAWAGVKSLARTAVIAGVLYMAVKALAPVLLGAGLLPLSSTLSAVGSGVHTLLIWSFAAGMTMAAFDVVVVVRRNRKKTRMSRQELKEENKRSEGDPQLKSAIRSKQLAMSRNRMMAAIADADVVLVNPTHVAVALKYTPGAGAPRVVAKGSGEVAAAIRAKADECGVLMIADIPLARALHAACDLGQEVPEDLFAAVATVLAFCMLLRRRGQASGTHTSPRTGALPTVAVTAGRPGRTTR